MWVRVPQPVLRSSLKRAAVFTTCRPFFFSVLCGKARHRATFEICPPYMPSICPLYGPCICPLFGSRRKSFTGLFSGFECPKRRPPRAATREVFGKCNIRTFVSDEVMLAYRSVLSTLFLHLTLSKTDKTDSARHVGGKAKGFYQI